MANSIVGPAGIVTISGALMKPQKKNGHKCGSYMIATHRTAQTTNPNCQRIYVKTADAFQRSTPVKETEILQRARFATVASAVNTRLHDTSKQQADIAAWRAQKDLVGGKTTLKSYIWSLELDAYDQQHQG